MPTIETVNGIKINIYSRDHVPPHIHALYNEDEALLVIKTGRVYAGWLSGRQLRRARAWLKKNETDALKIFYELNPNLQ